MLACASWANKNRYEEEVYADNLNKNKKEELAMNLPKSPSMRKRRKASLPVKAMDSSVASRSKPPWQCPRKEPCWDRGRRTKGGRDQTPKSSLAVEEMDRRKKEEDDKNKVQKTISSTMYKKDDVAMNEAGGAKMEEDHKNNEAGKFISSTTDQHKEGGDDD